MSGVTEAHASAMRVLANRFFGAIEAGDIEGVSSCYAPDAIIWHNDDRLETSPKQNLEILGQFIANVPKRVYANRRFFPVEGGFVQQHDTELHLADGRVLTLPVCIVFTVVDGKIQRLDEYLDRATLDRWAKGGS